MKPLRLLGLSLLLYAGTALARPELLVSIDGLRPADVLDAEKRGLHLPNLRALPMAQG